MPKGLKTAEDVESLLKKTKKEMDRHEKGTPQHKAAKKYFKTLTQMQAMLAEKKDQTSSDSDDTSSDDDGAVQVEAPPKPKSKKGDQAKPGGSKDVRADDEAPSGSQKGAKRPKEPEEEEKPVKKQRSDEDEEEVKVVETIKKGKLIFVKTVSHAIFPYKGSVDAAGYDLSSAHHEEIASGETRFINTGIQVVLPEGTYGRIADRSSLASLSISVMGGVIDRDYTGSLIVIMHNLGKTTFKIAHGDRVAQLIVERNFSEEAEMQSECDYATLRGEGGFGSTGIKHTK